MNSHTQYVLFLFGAVALAFLFHFTLSKNIPDADSLYHIRHAWLYKTHSLFFTDFPWTSASVIKTNASDLWYGFHLFLVPFSYASDLVLGIRLAGVFLTSLLLLITAYLARQYALRLPFLWPFFLFLIIPNVLFYFLMVRPHILSLALGLLLLSSLIRKSSLGIVSASAGITFFHASYFWFGPLIATAWAAAEFIRGWQQHRAIPPIVSVLRPAVLIVIGTVGGIMARPNPLGTINGVYTQIIELVLVKMRGLPLTFGIELLPLHVDSLFTTSFLFLAMWGAALALWGFSSKQKHGARERKDGNNEENAQLLLSSTVLLSVIFFLLTIGIAIRFFIGWVAFGTLFIAAVYTKHTQEKSFRQIVDAVLPVLFIFMLPFAIWRHGLNDYYVGTPAYELRPAAGWLKQNTAEGDIVFHLHWDEFGQLFSHNQHNYYVGGMDPIFQFKYNPELYWKFHYLSIDEVSDYTCRAFPCTREGLVDTYNVLVNDFHARYVFVEKDRNPAFLAYLETDPRYTNVFEDRTTAVFSIQRE